MKINDLNKGDVVVLDISKGETGNQVEGRVMITNNSNTVILEPIIIDEKVLVLDSNDIKIDLLIMVKNEKPQIWRNVSFGMAVVNGRSCIAIKSSVDSVVHNRRRSFRLPMDVQGYLKTEKIVVRDISSTGISFYTKLEDKKIIGNEIKINFTANYEDISVTGRIVREENDGERNIYGCTINSTPAVDNFIASEQRNRMTVGRRKKQ